MHCVMALESLFREDEGNRKRVADIEGRGSSIRKCISWDSSVSKNRSNISLEQVKAEGDITVDDEELLLPHVTAKYQAGEASFSG